MSELRKPTAKMQRKIDNIIFLKEKLTSWKELPEKELITYVTEYEKACLQEGSGYFTPLFNDKEFAKILLEIAYHCKENEKITRSFINSYGMMNWRYKLPETKEWYQFFKENSLKNKGIGLAVAYFIKYMKYFKKDSEKWEYILKVANLKPKKEAPDEFRSFFNEKYICFQEMPKNYFEKYIAIIEKWNIETDNEVSISINNTLIEKIKSNTTHLMTTLADRF